MCKNISRCSNSPSLKKKLHTFKTLTCSYPIELLNMVKETCLFVSPPCLPRSGNPRCKRTASRAGADAARRSHVGGGAHLLLVCGGPRGRPSPAARENAGPRYSHCRRGEPGLLGDPPHSARSSVETPQGTEAADGHAPPPHPPWLARPGAPRLWLAPDCLFHFPCGIRKLR